MARVWGTTESTVLSRGLPPEHRLETVGVRKEQRKILQKCIAVIAHDLAPLSPGKETRHNVKVTLQLASLKEMLLHLATFPLLC